MWVDGSNFRWSDDQGVKELAFTTATVTGDYAGALKALNDPGLEFPVPLRDAGRAVFQALLSRNPAAKAAAIAKADALPLFPTRDPILMLGVLGAYPQALKRIDQTQSWGGPRIWLWYPSMAGAQRDQGFPALAQRLGLMKYWRATHTKPDVCSQKDPPPFCRMI